MSSKKGRKKAEPSDDDKLRARVEFVNGLAETEAFKDSPINIDISNATPIILPKLTWFNYELPPKKMKITNTGHTVILSAKWYDERPFLANGPLQSVYVFNQMHFHWGDNDCDGSEHLVEKKTYPLEMHVVHFKSSYASQDIALREKDGMVVLIYFFEIQDRDNLLLDTMIQGLPYISPPHTSVQIMPFAITETLPTFAEDYFVYWGCVNAVACKHRVMWIVSREKMGISSSQLEQFRSLMSTEGQPLPKHVRKVATSPRTVFHVNGGATPTAKTLLPVRDGPLVHISQRGPGYKKRVPVSLPAEPEPILQESRSRPIPVFTVENSYFKMPYQRDPEVVQSCRPAREYEESLIPPCKSVSFSGRQDFLRMEEERRAYEEKLMQEKMKRAREEELWRLTEDRCPQPEGVLTVPSEVTSLQGEDERSQSDDNQMWRLEKESRQLEEQKRQLQAMQEKRWQQEQMETPEMSAHRQQLQAQWQRVRQQETERQKSQEWRGGDDDDEQFNVYHVATQKPSIGFKLRKPHIDVKRKLDVATQAPSFTAMYRPANALSTMTVYPGSDGAIGTQIDETAFEGGGLGTREVTAYPVSFKSIKPAIKALSSYTASVGYGNVEYSTLSCFDTKDFHVTPKGSIAPTASVRIAQQDVGLHVYSMDTRHETDRFASDKTTSDTRNGFNTFLWELANTFASKKPSQIACIRINPLLFSHHFDDSGYAILTNNGLSVEVKLLKTGVQIPVLRGGPLFNDVYVFSGLHILWHHCGIRTTQESSLLEGSDSTQEDLNGKQFDMYVYLVHIEQNCRSMEEALNTPDGVAVVGFPVEAGVEDEPYFQQILSALPLVKTPRMSIPVRRDVMRLVESGAKSRGFYHHIVSLTNCSRSVLCFSYPESVKISHNQMTQFKEISSQYFASLTEETFKLPTRSPRNVRMVYVT